MVNSSTNINKTKLKQLCQQFHQYQQNKTKQRLNSYVNNFTNINKTKQSLSSDGQQFHQYQHNEHPPLISNHRTHKTPTTYRVQNPGPDVGQEQQVWQNLPN